MQLLKKGLRTHQNIEQTTFRFHHTEGGLILVLSSSAQPEHL